MSEEVRKDSVQPIPPEEELEVDAAASAEIPTEKLGAEGRQGMGDLTQKDRERNEYLKAGGRSGISREFGRIDFFETPTESTAGRARATAVEKALTTPLGDKPGTESGENSNDASKERTPAEAAAAEFEKKGRSALAETNKGLTYTTDGSAPPVVEMNDKFTVASEKTPVQLAEERLGSSASKQQKEHYARMILYRNDDFSDDLTKKIPAGTVLKMPGQTADGGVTYRDPHLGSVVTEWQNGSTLRVQPDGSGSAQYTTADSWHVDVRWHPRNSQDTGEDRMKGDNAVNIDSSGLSREKIWDKTKQDWEVVRFTRTDEKGRTFVGDYKPGDAQPHTIKITNSDKSTVDLKPVKAGDFVSADGKTGMDQRFNVYSLTTESDGSVTKSYDNGDKVKLDSAGRTLHQEGKDDWTRAYSYDYKAGEKTPHTVRITPKEGEAPVELKRGKGNKYLADLLDADKKKVGTIELGADSRLVYKNDKEKTQHTELKDGTTLDRKQHPGGVTVTMAKAGESQVTEYDKKGQRTAETSITSDGRQYTKTFSKDGKSVEGVAIASTDGSKTELVWDKNAEQFRGERKDPTGKVLEKVTLLEDKLVYTDETTGTVRGEKYSKRSKESLIPHFIPGDYDRNTGTFTYKNDDGSKTVESFAPGRTDRVKTDGTIEGTTVRGDKSSLKRSGEATVEHSDHTGVRLNSDLTIDRWGPLASDNATGEKLSPTEEKFVQDHADIDRRQVAEIHRRFGGDRAKLESFYKALDKLESAKNLSDTEKSALRKDLLNHVAFPQEIYQGRTPSCNVSVVERDMAMASPDKYVSMIVQAVSDGQITTSDGTKVPLDPDNLKLADSSGRDLASRIFQTTAIQAEFYPRREFRNSEDGVGRLYPSPYNPLDKPVAFAGMTMPHIADVRYKLTGEEKGITQVATVDDLVTAFEANGGQPMIIAVDGTNQPFGGGGPVGTGSNLNHVVTITRIEKGNPPKIYVANQWGLNNDHSSPETAIDANKLVDNMQLRVKSGGKITKFPGMVLSPGDHTKGYAVKKGTVVEDKAMASAIAKGRAIIPGES